VTLRVTDSGNGDVNLSLHDERSFRLIARASNAAPVLATIGARSVREGATLTIDLSASDPDGDKLSFLASALPSGAQLDPVTGRFTWTPGLFQAGIYSGLTLRATDGNLTDSETITIEVTNNNQPPVLVALPPQSGREGIPLQFTLSSGDIDGDPLLYSLSSSLPAGRSSTSGPVSSRGRRASSKRALMF
jgi:hypothetical protein